MLREQLFRHTLVMPLAASITITMVIAAEWEAWLELFGVPLLDQRLDEECVQNFRDLSRIYSIATRHSVSLADIALLKTLVVRFVRSEHLNHVRFTAAGHGQETADTPTLAYPALQGRYKAQLASYQSSRLARICSDVEEVEFYKRCQVRDDLTIGSTASQRAATITRSNCRVCYAEPEDNEMRFGTIHFFIRVLSVDGQDRELAWISQLEDVDIDREKRIASFGTVVAPG